MPDSSLPSPIHHEIVDALVTMHRLTDDYTAGHEHRTASLSVKIAHRLDLKPDRIEVLRMAAQVHDIGKVKIAPTLLHKPGRLSEEEFAVIKTHVQVSYDILNPISFPFNLAEIVWCHHESLDGSGYPRAITGDAIPLEARILTVADIVESMSSDRPYRKAVGMEAALAEIARLRDTRLDPRVVDACVDIVQAGRARH